MIQFWKWAFLIFQYLFDNTFIVDITVSLLDLLDSPLIFSEHRFNPDKFVLLLAYNFNNINRSRIKLNFIITI